MRSRWLDIGQVLFLHFYGPKNAKTKKNEANIQSSSLVNKGFIIWPYHQVKNTTTERSKTKQNMKLFCSERNCSIPSRCKIYFQCIFGLACNHGKQGILNYLKALALQWLKGSMKLLSRKNLDFRKGGRCK